MSMEYVAEQEAKAQKIAEQQKTQAEGNDGNEPGSEPVNQGDSGDQ